MYTHKEVATQAIALLHGVMEADKQDAKMGHPNPGDSCVSIYLALVVYQFLAEHEEYVR